MKDESSTFFIINTSSNIKRFQFTLTREFLGNTNYINLSNISNTM